MMVYSIFTCLCILSFFIGSIWSAPAPYPQQPRPIPSVEGSPTSFPALTDDSKIPALQQLALGTLPNGPAPPAGGISANGLTSLQLIELNEFFEAAFFLSLLSNITTNEPGFEIVDGEERTFVIDALVTIIAQEQLHGIFADKVLKSQKQETIKPCQYKFPSNTFAEAIALAATFTDVVLGTLQDVIEIFADNNDNALTRGVASVVGQEGQQSGFYRILENKNKFPSELPFLTTSTRDFAFSSLQQGVIVSCPNDNVLKQKLKIFGVLNLLTANVEPKDQNLQFSFDLSTLSKSNIVDSKPASGSSSYSAYGNTYDAGYDWSQVSLVYINQQNTPIVEKLQNVKVAGTVVTFDAFFPHDQYLLNGLIIASVVKSSGPFTSAGAVANSTLFAPAFIEIN